MSIVFTEFELIYHRAWAENVGQVNLIVIPHGLGNFFLDIMCSNNFIFQVRIGLIAPLLIRHPLTNMYIINFSIYIPECIREVEYMWQLGLCEYC